MSVNTREISNFESRWMDATKDDSDPEAEAPDKKPAHELVDEALDFYLDLTSMLFDQSEMTEEARNSLDAAINVLKTEYQNVDELILNNAIDSLNQR